jgi:ring-1,2-phenylacetyl-CoA epoxidase subunit PaaD
MVTPAAVWAALAEVHDPEIPVISLVDMGMVHQVAVESGTVTVTLLPTFVGCPALAIIREAVIRRVAELPGVEAVTVTFTHDPPWTSDRITPRGRERLKAFGIAPPAGTAGCAGDGGTGLLDLLEVPSCPYCGSGNTHLENLFGPTACRSIYYCDDCRQPFEGMKSV